VDEPDFFINKNQGVAIVGLGLIGGSIAGALKINGFKNIMGIDTQNKAIEDAINKDFIKLGDTEPENILPLAEVVIVCLYPKETAEFIKKHMNDFKYKAVITDVSGIKLDLINEINSCLRADLEFVGGHPMAGSHFRGFDHANPHLFMDANYIITPTDTSSLEAISKIKSLAKILGCKSISEINPGKHDEAMALASHMPHITALALMDMCDVREMGALLGPSFKDATRVAQINSRLWAQLLISNKDNLDEQIKIMEKKMEQLRKAIISSDIKELEHLMEQAGSKRRKIG